jgi:Protein of unknown function (DUF3562)
MYDPEMKSQDIVGVESEIQLLARETGVPVETVHEIYNIEHAKLDRIARIKTYVPVLLHRHVKELLQMQRTLNSFSRE